MKRIARCLPLLLALLPGTGCQRSPEPAAAPDLAGAWRSKLQFQSGPFAAVKDLEFLYAFNPGGTMTESSNYDAAPPVPPAYGVWRKLGPREFEAKYEFYATRAPDRVPDLAGGWLPAGRGVLVERITLAPDGQTFTSRIHYQAYDPSGAPEGGGAEADGQGTRLGF